MGDLSAWSSPVQAGFAAFAVLLLGFCMWLVRQIVALSRQTQSVVQANTEAITRQLSMLEAVLRDVEECRLKMERLETMVRENCYGEEKAPQDGKAR